MSDHLYKPGQSGNPAGKPKGAGDRRLEVRKMLESRSQEVVDTLIDMALKDRDTTALKLIMERISPKPRAESVNLGIQVNNLSNKEEMRKMISDVLVGTLKGDVPDDQGKSIAALVKSASEMDQRMEDARRLDAIEERLGIKNG
jgi:hypothetical protein